MKIRNLGKSNLEVSALGLGCMGFTQSYPPYPDRNEAIGVLNKNRFPNDFMFQVTKEEYNTK